MAVQKKEPTSKKYHAATVASFEKAYGVKLKSTSKTMRLSTYMSKSSAPSMGKLLKAVEKTLSK